MHKPEITGDVLRELFELHNRMTGYALAAIVKDRPGDVNQLLATLRRCMAASQDASDPEVADAATAPFLAMLEGAQDFVSDSQEPGA